jgi:hypothetical protein
MRLPDNDTVHFVDFVNSLSVTYTHERMQTHTHTHTTRTRHAWRGPKARARARTHLKPPVEASLPLRLPPFPAIADFLDGCDTPQLLPLLLLLRLMMMLPLLGTSNRYAMLPDAWTRSQPKMLSIAFGETPGCRNTQMHREVSTRCCLGVQSTSALNRAFLGPREVCHTNKTTAHGGLNARRAARHGGQWCLHVLCFLYEAPPWPLGGPARPNLKRRHFQATSRTYWLATTSENNNVENGFA